MRWGRRGISARLAALVLGIHVALQQVDLYFLIPHILGRQVRLHPLVVIIGIIGGGMLAGVLGILLVAPAIASGVALARYACCKSLDLPPWEDPDAHDEEEGGNGG